MYTDISSGDSTNELNKCANYTQTHLTAFFQEDTSKPTKQGPVAQEGQCFLSCLWLSWEATGAGIGQNTLHEKMEMDLSSCLQKSVQTTGEL